MSSENLEHGEAPDEVEELEEIDPMAQEMDDLKRREDAVLLRVERRRLELTESLLNSNPTDEDRQKYITEIRKLEAIRMAHGSSAEKGKLFSLEVPEFAVKNKDDGNKDAPVASVVDEGKQIIHRVLETMKGAMYKEKVGNLDIWEKNRTSKRRGTVQGSRYQRRGISRKLRHLKPQDDRPEQNQAGTVGASRRIVGQAVPETDSF